MRLDAGTLKWAALIVPIVTVPAVLFYVTHHGSERMILSAPAAPAAAEHGSAGLEPLLERLENRLRAGGGSDADWELLAKTYDYLGRKSDAANARHKHRVAGATAATPTTAAATPTTAAPTPATAVATAATEAATATGAATTATGAATTATPADTKLQRRVAAVLSAADHARAAHDYSAAKSDYDQVVALGRMSAQSWADYADVAASLDGGHWDAAAQRYLAAALTLDPTNEKALWLSASAQHAEEHYTQAISTWTRLLALTPADAPEAEIFAANLEEDRRLAARAAALRR